MPSGGNVKGHMVSNGGSVGVSGEILENEVGRT